MVRLLSLVLLLGSMMAAEALPWRSGGPRGGRVEALVRAASDPAVWYIAARDGVYRSEDRGETWTVASRITDGIGLTVDPTDPRRLYAWRETPTQTPNVLRSTDGGETWQALTSGLVYERFYGVVPVALLVDPRNPQELLLASACIYDDCRAGGLYHSSDGGDTWTRGSGLEWPSSLSRDPLSPDTLYASDIFRGSVRSDDNGRTWTNSVSPVPSRVVVADPLDAARRYGIAPTSDVLITENAGRTWERKDVYLLAGNGIGPWNYGTLDVDPKTGRLFLGTNGGQGNGVYRSGDRGASWLPVENEGREPVNGLLFDDATGKLTIATVTGIYRANGIPWSAWSEVQVGHATHLARRVATHPRRPGTLFTIDFNRLFRSDDYGATWRAAAGAMPLIGNEAWQALELAVDAAGDAYVVVSNVVDPDRLLRLPAGSRDWIDLGGRGSGPLVADPSLPGTVYTGPMVTRDNGTTWEPFVAPPYTERLTVDPTNPLRLFASTRSPGNVVESTDGGRTWVRHFEGVLVSSDIVISPTDPRVVTFLGRSFTDRYVFRTTDGGVTWTTYPPATTDGSTFDFWYGESLVADPRNARTLYARTGSGVFRTIDGGETWHSLTRGLPSAYLWSLAIDADARFLHVGTAEGAWDLPLGTGRRRSVR
jgi:photosystem II stability/assembly factor-like uncharacterized protein